MTCCPKTNPPNSLQHSHVFDRDLPVKEMLNSSEADARINIDQLLRDAGWDPADKQQVSTESAITVSGYVNEIDSIPTARLTDAPYSTPKKADYILHAVDGKPLAIIEAKRIAIDPYRAKEQALAYARAIGAPFIFLSNGDAIYFWDYLEGDVRLVASFFSQRDLERLVHQRKNRQNLALLPIIEDYIRAGEVRFVRPYQQDCMFAMDSAILLGKRRFLAEQIDENFRAWLVAHQFTPEQASFLSMLKARGVANGHVELGELFEPPLVHSNAPEKASQLFGSALKEIVAELNSQVFDSPASA